MPPSEAFLSHASADETFASKLAEVLCRHGVPVWFSPTHVRGAQQWHDQIGAALERCDWFLLLLSPAAVDSEWVKRELLFVLDEERYRGKIVPVLHRDCEYRRLSWVLRTIQFVDFRGDFHDGCRELLRVWGMTYVP